MAFIPAVNTARCVFRMTQNGQVVQHVIHVQKATAWDQSSLTDLANLLITWWNDEYAPNAGNGLGLTGVQARDMTAEEAPAVEIGAPPLSGGDLNDEVMPGNVTLAIRFSSALSGRSRRGRAYQCGLTNAQVLSNEMILAARDAIVAGWAALKTTLDAASYTWVIASFYHGVDDVTKKPIPRATALLTPVTSVSADSFVDSQRRRLTGRGV